MRYILMLILTISIYAKAIMVQYENDIEKSEPKKNLVVKNILIQKIKDNKIFSTNGKVYKIPKNAKIIKNYTTKKPLIAELHLKNKRIILVILK